jgi:hypothetical protein
MGQREQTSAGQSQPSAKETAARRVQLEMHVTFEPTAFPSESRIHLFYELHLTNIATVPLGVSRLDALDANAAAAQPVVTFQAEQLESMFQLIGDNTAAVPKGSLSIPSGRTAVVFIEIAFRRDSRVPERLVHRVITTEGLAEGAAIATHHEPLHLLGPPLEGSNWLASDGPGNGPDNHHRRGLLIVDGRALISRRYAIDWKQVKVGASFSGDPRDVRSYYAYGKAVLAVADGRVITARDGLPDNIPGHNEAFHPAVPITLDTVAGNTMTIDLGGGQFAYYMHLEPGSLRVKAGDRVRRGQVLARVGCSGDAREPHLHFQVTDSPKLMAGEGLPYLIDRYQSMNASGGSPEVHVRELPLNNTIAVFGEGGGR